MKKVWKKGLALLLCLVLNSSMVAFANETQDENTKNQEESFDEISEEKESKEEQYSEDENSREENSEETSDLTVIPETSDTAGWKEIDNNRYYYDANKQRVSGWYKINNSWYYFDGKNETCPGIMLKDTVCQIEGKYYLFGSDGVMLTGWVKRTEGWYYANKDGSLALGWKKSGNKWYYLDKNIGLMAENTTMLIDGEYYEFDADGAMLIGWIKKTEGWYYANADGSLALGWKKSGNKWYYLDKGNLEHVGLMVADTNMLIDGKYYGFNADGAMLTGWIERAEGWYYANPNGDFAMKWKKSGSKWYYLDPNDVDYPGRMLSDVLVEIDGLSYVFLPSGAMKTGWEKVDENWYYYDTYSGQLVSEWNKINGKWYYFEPNTKQMAPAGWHEIDGTYYYMNPDGDMATGWKYINNKWYYFGTGGNMSVGWKMIGGFWYYFYAQNDPHGGTYGAMASNTTIDGYKILSNGMYLNAVQSRMYASAQGYGSSSRYLIMIDTANCKLGVFTGTRGHWTPVKYWSCSPGAPATPTVKGVFSVGSKGYYFDSGNLRLYWYTQFYGDYLIHSVCYLHDGSPADLRTGMHLSHGCVRLQIDNAKWVYDNIPRGSTVVAY